VTKYSYEYKLEVVRFYEASMRGRGYTSAHFRISKELVRVWVWQYSRFGETGLRKKLGKTKYSSEFKMEVIESVIGKGHSLRSAASEYGLLGSSMVASWLNTYRKHGIEGLKPKPKGRKPAMAKKIKIDFSKPDSEKSREELLEELEYMRAQSAYVKKWNALMEEQARQGKVRLK
jgi:transposase